jgi:hypothetical protein
VTGMSVSGLVITAKSSLEPRASNQPAGKNAINVHLHHPRFPKEAKFETSKFLP